MRIAMFATSRRPIVDPYAGGVHHQGLHFLPLALCGTPRSWRSARRDRGVEATTADYVELWRELVLSREERS